MLYKQKVKETKERQESLEKEKASSYGDKLEKIKVAREKK